MEDEQSRRIHTELGEGINPAFIERLLIKDVPNLLIWLQNNLRDTDTTIAEALYYANLEDYQDARQTLSLGIRILDDRFKMWRFILKEVESRIEAIDVSAKPILLEITPND